MHCHFKDVLMNYDPVHGFWLFSFERYNGIFEKQPNNNKNIEVQLMRRFLNDSSVISLNLPQLFSNEFSNLVQRVNMVEVGSNAQTILSKHSSQGNYVFPESYIHGAYHTLRLALHRCIYIKADRALPY